MNEPDAPMQPESAATKSPFVFGVSGHRDVRPEDTAELKSHIQLVFGRFRLAYPAASFELLSPLAEGADRIAAEVAVHSGIRLVVPMPMAQTEYEKDFGTQESLGEFRRLLATADSHFEVRDTEPGSDRRSKKYAVVGDYIARRSHVLILLWDGQDNEKIGGTAWVKKRREHWVNSTKAGDKAPPVFGYAGTIHIVTPRLTDADSHPEIEIIGDLPPIVGGQADERSKL
ncbi:MAG: hypothetical protein ACJ8NS_09135 [Chthoniobacterales bacterium]|jgi:hypothetical protein